MGLSSSDVMNALGITKATLYKWELIGKIKPKLRQIGTRKYRDYDPAEVERVKSLMKKKREDGKSLLKGD